MQYITMTTELPPFLPYPRFLLELPLSETARLVYCVILSRILISRHNGWVDEAGRVYCRYPILALAKDCSRGKSAILTAVAALEKQGLLTRQKGGAGRANTLYLRVPDEASQEYRRAAAICGIFTGGIPATFYSEAKKEYLQPPMMINPTPFVIAELRELLGDDNVVVK